MKKKCTVIFIYSFFSLIGITTVFSQATGRDTIAHSIMNAAGGSATFNNTSFEWSIGESITTETMSNGSMVFTHGILQSLPTSRFPDTRWSVDEIKIFPIPSKDWVTIQFFSIETGRIFLTVHDAEGRLVHTKQFDYAGTGLIEMLNVSKFASGIYYLRIRLEINPLTNSIQKDGTYKIQVLR
jgi:hypothetical protein